MNREIRSTDAPTVGLFGSVKDLAASLVSHLHIRLQLFATEFAAEFAEEKLRLTSLLFGAIAALFFAFMTLVFAALFVIAAYLGYTLSVARRGVSRRVVPGRCRDFRGYDSR